MENYKAKFVMGNVKLGNNIASFSKLYGDQPVHVKRLDIDVIGTCGGYCYGCMRSCYVPKSYRYDSVVYRHAVNTLAFRNNIDQAFIDLYNQLWRKRNKPTAFRIDQSGELETEAEFDLWINMAICFPDIPFYVYTKAYDIVTEALLSGRVPLNFTVLYSIWHEQGIKEYARVCHLPNVKAFVYDNNDFDYFAFGILIQTYCKAYDEKGKLNHDITCDKCRKCFDNSPKHKIIGCKAH